jgi:SSS family solute:Na+ symporter
MFAISCVCMVGVSLFTRPTGAARLDATVWRRALWDQDSEALRSDPWYRNWRVLSILLLVVTAAIVVWWW